MRIGVGLDGTLGLGLDDQAELAREAARLGYTSVWTPEGAGEDGFQICAQRWLASRDVVAEGLTTGIAVSPIALRTPVSLAMSAGTLTRWTGGRFILGIGTGGLASGSYRRSLGIPANASPLHMMREYLLVTRALLAGETVTQEGESIALHGVRLAFAEPPRTPVYLGALGPRMLRLGGELADGIALNWCTSQQVAWSRDRVAEGAVRAGRDPASVAIAKYIRICVDDDVALARRALARATLGYALGPRKSSPQERAQGYRAHFERMGFAQALSRLDTLRERDASADALADACPDDLLLSVGYYGAAEGAAPAFRRLAQGLDIAVVRVVAARPGKDAANAVMRACRAELTGA